MDHNERIMHWTDQHLSELSQLDDETGVEIMKACGKACCELSELYDGALRLSREHLPDEDIDRVYEKFKQEYYSEGKMTKTGDIITLIFESCTCPLVKRGTSHAFLCNCTTGYTERLFEVLFNRKVTVDLEQSILKGDRICKQSIYIQEEQATDPPNQ